MSIDRWLFFVGFSSIFISFLISKKRRIAFYFFVLGIFLVFAPRILPNRFFGNWNTIKELKNKQIAYVVLRPGLHNSKFNLTDSTMVILAKSKLGMLVSSLREARIFIPNHPSTIWVARLTAVSIDGDSVSVIIEQTQNNGTIIKSNKSRFRKDEVGDFLERVTNYQAPVQ